MEVSEGRQYFGVGIDLTQLSADAQSAKEMLRSISTQAVKDGEVLDNAFAGQSMQKLSDDIAKVAEKMKDWDFGTAEEKIAALSAVINENEQVILSNNEKIKEWKEQAQEAFNSGDIATFNDLTQKILETSDTMQELILETNDYATALEAVKGVMGAEAGSLEPVRLFDSEADIRECEELKKHIESVKNEMRTLGASGGDTSALQADLEKSTDRLNSLQDAAAKAAAKLGNDLATRASEAQQNLYELNTAIETQQGVITDLTQRVADAKTALDELQSSENAGEQEIAQATASCEYYSQALQQANDQMSALQGLQVDATTQWQNVSAEVQQHDSLMVKMLGGYQNYNQILSQLPAPLQSVIGGITGMTGAAKAFIATPLGAIIAAIVLALQALYQWFNSSVEGQMAFAKISGYVSGVLGQLKEIVLAVGKAIYKAFSNPKEAIKNLWESIKTNLLNRVKAIANMFADLGKVIMSALDLDWDGVKKNLKAVGNDFLQATTGVENLADKVVDWAEGVHTAAKATSDIAVASKELEIQASEWQKRSAELDKAKAEAQRKMYDTSLSAEERKKAMADYKAALQEQTNTELALQNKRIEIQERSMALTTNAIEDENKLRDLQAGRIRIEAQHEQSLASLQRRENMLNRSGASAAKAGESARAKAARRADSNAATIATANMGMTAYERGVAEQQRNLGYQMEQARIDGMKDGFEKVLAQNKLNWDKLMADNVKRAEDMTKDYRDKLFNDWMAQNPEATKGEQAEYKLFLETEITADDLPEQIKQMLASYEDMANEAFNRANAEALESALSDVQTYAQQREKILADYAKREEALYNHDADGNRTGLREGVSQGNVDELQRQRDEALSSVDEQFAQREEEFQAWCNAIGNLSLEQLQGVLENAKRKLAELQASGKATDAELAVARAKVDKATKAVKTTKAKNDVSPGKRSIKEWEDLYKTLNDVRGSFEEIGDTVGGVVGDIISECGKMASSTLTMINGIVQLVNMSKTGIEGTAMAGATAISTMEKASVILTIISAAMQIAMQIINLFNNDDKKQEEIEALQGRIDQLQWELDNAELMRSRKLAQGGTYVAQLRQLLYETRVELVKNGIATQNWLLIMQGAYGSVSNSADLMKGTVDKLAKAYGNMSYTADKALGAEKYKSANDQLKNIAEQQLLIQEQIDLERSKKKTDNDAIKEYEQKIEELGQQALEVINDMVEDIIGDSASGIAEQLADAFFEAFEAGEDAAEAWGDAVNDIVGDILKRMMVQKFLEEPLGQIFNKYKAKWFPDGEFAGLDPIINSMTDFANDLNGELAGFQAVMDALPDELKQYFLGKIEDERSASEGGIATASQESVDELNGRATAIQTHTHSISENTKLLVANSTAILTSVLNIETHTGSMEQSLGAVRTDIKQMRATIDDIQRRGLKMTN